LTTRGVNTARITRTERRTNPFSLLIILSNIERNVQGERGLLHTIIIFKDHLNMNFIRKRLSPLCQAPSWMKRTLRALSPPSTG